MASYYQWLPKLHITLGPVDPSLNQHRVAEFFTTKAAISVWHVCPVSVARSIVTLVKCVNNRAIAPRLLELFCYLIWQAEPETIRRSLR